MPVHRRLTTSITVIALATAGLVGAIAVPSALATRRIRAEIDEAKIALDQRVAMFRYIRQSSSNLEDAKRRLAVLADMAVHEGRELDFITTLEGIAQASDIEQTINLNTANQKEISLWEKEIPLQLTVMGEYDDFRSYLNAIEGLNYAVIVRSVNMISQSRTADTNPAGEVRATIDATVYWISKDSPSFAESAARK
jgi:hypothetical protein